MSKEVVIRIKASDEHADELKSLVDILTEVSKPEWRTRLPGWRAGPRSLSERAIALMLEAVRSNTAAVPAAKLSIARPGALHSKENEDENPFG